MVIKLGSPEHQYLCYVSRYSGTFIVQGQGFTLSFLTRQSFTDKEKPSCNRGVRTKDNANNVFGSVSDTQIKKKNNSKYVLIIYYVPGIMHM